MSGERVELTQAEIHALAGQVYAHPPDHKVTISNAADGTLHNAEWMCGGKPASMGSPRGSSPPGR